MFYCMYHECKKKVSLNTILLAKINDIHYDGEVTGPLMGRPFLILIVAL